MSHANERCEIAALTAITAPTASVTPPTQSHLDQRAYSRFARALVATSASAATTNAAGTTASCSRTKGEISDASTAPVIHHRVRVASALAIRNALSIAQG